MDELMRLLCAQHLVVGRAQALDCGVTDAQLARLCRDGVLERLCPATYGLVGAPVTNEHHIMRAIVAARQRSTTPELVAVTRLSAAWLLGMTGKPPKKAAILVPHKRTPDPDLPAVKVHRSRTLRAEDIAIVRGIPTTTGARTIADATMNLAIPQLMDLIAKGLHLELFTLAELSEQLRRAGRIRGAPRLREALRRLDPDVALAESRGERAGFEALRAAGFDVVLQHPVDLLGRRYRLDLVLLALGLAIEIDGYWWHFSPEQKRRDDARQNDLKAAGFEVLRFSADLVIKNPSIVVDAVRAFAANRAA